MLVFPKNAEKNDSTIEKGLHVSSMPLLTIHSLQTALWVKQLLHRQISIMFLILGLSLCQFTIIPKNIIL